MSSEKVAKGLAWGLEMNEKEALDSGIVLVYIT